MSAPARLDVYEDEIVVPGLELYYEPARPSQWLSEVQVDEEREIEVVPLGDAVHLRAINQVIVQSRQFLELEDNWDGEGSLGYSEQTWLRAADFVRAQARLAREVFCGSLAVPEIVGAERGSFDVLWKFDDISLLVNVPKDSAERATFYGEGTGGDTFWGQLNTGSVRPDLASWVLRRP